MAHNIHVLVSPEAQRTAEIRFRQEEDIRNEWNELMELIKARQMAFNSIPRDIKRVIDLDNLILERSKEYARATIYINLT